jgi:HlyD family secretion protein
MACEDIKQNFELAKGDFDRGSRLFKIGSLSQENYDHLKSKRDDTLLKLDWCSVTAIKDTKVLNTYREVGEYVIPGTKLLTLVNLSEVWTIIYVPQPLLAKISIGMKVTGYLPELKMRSFEGKITKISDAAEFTPKNVQTREERTRLVFGVKVTFSNPEELLKPGMSLEIKLE